MKISQKYKSRKCKKIIKLCCILAYEFVELLQKIYSTISFFAETVNNPTSVGNLFAVSNLTFLCRKAVKMFRVTIQSSLTIQRKFRECLLKEKKLTFKEYFYVSINFRKHILQLFRVVAIISRWTQ